MNAKSVHHYLLLTAVTILGFCLISPLVLMVNSISDIEVARRTGGTNLWRWAVRWVHSGM